MMPTINNQRPDWSPDRAVLVDRRSPDFAIAYNVTLGFRLFVWVATGGQYRVMPLGMLFVILVGGILASLSGCQRAGESPSPQGRESLELAADNPSESLLAERHEQVASPPTRPSSLSQNSDLSERNIIEGKVDRVRVAQPSWMNDRDDPSSDGWESEVFNRAVGRQLKTIGKLLEHTDEIPVAQVEQLLAPGFSCNALRPDDVAIVFEDQSLVVHRGSVEGSPQLSPEADSSDPAGVAEQFVSLLKHLAHPLPDDVRVKFKLFRVELKSTSVTTQAYYEASGHSASATVQQNARWICRWQPGSSMRPPRLLEIQVKDYEEVTTRKMRSALFADCTQAVLGHNSCFARQLLYGQEYWMRRIQIAVGTSGIGQGHMGLAIGDVNGDQLDDLYICQMSGLPNRLFVQNEDGTATDVSADAGVDFMEHTRGALLLDLDNDGDQDLVLALASAVLIMEGDGNGQFSQVAELPATVVYSLAAADYDSDGDLDIFACRYKKITVYDRSSGQNGAPIPYHDANNGAPSVMFRNETNWNFVDVTREVGLDVNNRRFSFAASWDDYDNDGDVDLYVANDYGRNNLYRNDVPTEGKFVDVAPETGVEDIATGMSAAWGDYNRDGWMDLYVGNMWSSAGNRITYQRKFHQKLGDEAKQLLRRTARGNTLFMNDGQGSFRDVSERCGVTMGRWAWSSPFIDLNNDGWEDLLVSNGFITNEDADDL